MIMDKNLLRSRLQEFLTEDIGRGDLTSESIFRDTDSGCASLVARQECIAAGTRRIAGEVFHVLNPQISITNCVEDGINLQPGDVLMTVAGPVIDLLKGERVALNLLQRLCGIATLTGQFVKAVEGTGVRITDTRKTTPGMRIFEKYAVRAGGGANHRFNLTDGVLIKDNHIAACGSISETVRRTREQIPHTIKIEVETDTLKQVEECLACKVDIIMLDNMDTETMTRAVQMINGQALVEASGGVRLETVREIAETGVDIISIGALTHSALSCDIGMDWVDEQPLPGC